MSNIQLKIVVEGRVQKVGYRRFILNTAAEFSLKGTVQNKENGTVEIHVQGTQMKLDQFLEWCYKGSPMAKVSKIDIEETPITNYSSFNIIK